MMSSYPKKQNEQQRQVAGIFLANCIHEARKRCGRVICPVCHLIFDATHLLKCPGCRTMINANFQRVRSKKTPKKMELDFFSDSLSGKQ